VDNDGEENGDEKPPSMDEMSDEEIEFANAFEVLRETKESTAPSPKRQKQKSALPLVVRPFSLQSNYRES
jgi:hypothetical protein